MSLTVKLENPPGVPVETFQFTPGQPLHLAIEVRGSLGLGESIPISMEIYPDTTGAFTPMYDSGYSNILGNKEFDVSLPFVVTKATIRIQASWPIGGVEEKLVHIGIGVDPGPQPGGVNWQKTLLYAGLAAGGVFLISKMIPQKTQVMATNPRRRHKKFRTWS
jgi:hypothetical protein